MIVIPSSARQRRLAGVSVVVVVAVPRTGDGSASLSARRSELREALGDSAARPETLPTRL